MTGTAFCSIKRRRINVLRDMPSFTSISAGSYSGKIDGRNKPPGGQGLSPKNSQPIVTGVMTCPAFSRQSSPSRLTSPSRQLTRRSSSCHLICHLPRRSQNHPPPPHSRLRNSRTRIHIHLFTAILVLVVLRLTLYIDQYITRAGGGGADGKERGIDNTVSTQSAY